jgi:hypothetical protein
MTSQTSVGEYHRLSLLDEAVVLYHSIGEDFIKLLDQYINVRPEEEKYLFISQDYILMGHVSEDDEGRYWHVSYAAHRKPEKTIDLFLRLAPFSLDRVRFCRYHNMDTDKYYNWKSLKRISKYGQQTKSTSTTSTASSATASSYTSSEKADQTSNNTV